MKIQASLLEQMIQDIPDTPPETGGILGGRDDVVTVYSLDKGLLTCAPCCYAPDTARLNGIISEWQSRGISFLGIFHTHFYGVESLSKGDKAYIARIMEAMPPCILSLYFPVVVLPSKELVVYKAVRSNGKIDIVADNLEKKGE